MVFTSLFGVECTCEFVQPDIAIPIQIKAMSIIATKIFDPTIFMAHPMLSVNYLRTINYIELIVYFEVVHIIPISLLRGHYQKGGSFSLSIPVLALEHT